MSTLLLIVLILVLLGALPSWPYSRGGAMARRAWLVCFSSWC